MVTWIFSIFLQRHLPHVPQFDLRSGCQRSWRLTENQWLKVVMVESHIGWFPYILDRLDTKYKERFGCG